MQDIIAVMSERDFEKAALRGEPSYVWRAGQQRRLEMIIKAVAAGFHVEEAPVRTVYEDGQSRSKMRIVRDTVRICLWSLMYRYAGM